jgi:capsular polysaccharide biosynthesis protein
MRPLKRLANKFLGHGPNRVAPFSTVAEARREKARGVHQPEGFDGILANEPGDTAAYTSGRALLGQPESSELIGGRPRYLAGGIPAPQEKVLYSLSDAAVVGSDGVVYCPLTRTAVAESMRSWTTAVEEHPVLAAPGLPPAAALPGCSLNLALLSGDGFYHFLVEGLPRLWLARGQRTQVRHVLVNGTPGSFHEKWLGRAGIDAANLVHMPGLAHHRCEQLLFTNYLMRDYQPTPWILAALRALLQAPAPAAPGKRRLWLSRADARSRQPAWESALLARLPGFERVTLSGLAPAEQIALMAEAAVVAGPHGAGLANLVFCAPGTKVVEIFPDTNRQPIYGRLANVASLPYAWAVADFGAAAEPAPLADAIRSFVHE